MKRVLPFLLLVLAGCEKAFLPSRPANNPQGVFKEMHTTISERYAYLGIKPVSWSSVVAQAEPKIHSGMSEQELFDVLADMLYQLEDGHVNLISPFDISRNWEWYLEAPDNYDDEVAEREYLGEDYRIAGNMSYRMLNDSVGYVRVPAFTSAIGTSQLDAVFSSLAGARGLIVDVRHNGGGSLNAAFALAGRLVNTERAAYTQWAKSGPDPGDFELEGTYVNSPSEGPRFNGPVVVLTNRRCYSATTFFAALVQPYEHISLLGDTTGGGGGLPFYSELPNGWTYRFSVTRAVGADGRELELGVVPDTAFHLDPALLEAGTDEYIETARVLFP